MALNIKNEEAHELAARLARLTGRSMTAVVVDALREQLDRVERQQSEIVLVQELMAIGRRCAAHMQQSISAVDHADLLYDERGMPQ